MFKLDVAKFPWVRYSGDNSSSKSSLWWFPIRWLSVNPNRTIYLKDNPSALRCQRGLRMKSEAKQAGQ